MKISLYFRLIVSVSIFLAFFVISQQSLAADTQSNSSAKAENALIKNAFKAYDMKNYKKAFGLFKRAAPNDATGSAQVMVGVMYEHGRGTPPNLKSALYWLGRSLEKTNNESLRRETICSMGMIYSKLRDFVVAFQYFKQAAMMGNSDAQFDSAQLFELGRGTIQDYVKAYAWVSVAIAQGLKNNKVQLGAEQFKNKVETYLNPYQLNQANDLAKEYFNLYVLHQPTRNN